MTAALNFISHLFWDSVLWNWTVAILIGACAETIFMAEHGQPFRDRLLNIQYGIVYALLIFVITPNLAILIAVLYKLTGTGLISLHIRGRGILSAIVAGLLLYLVTDFFYYWQHRLQHKLPILWAQHSLHHSERSLNVTTNMRHHWLEPILQAVFIGLPLTVLFDLAPASVITVGFLFSIWSFFIHMNLRLSLGRFSWVLCAPQVHRIHHSILAEHRDKNFAAYFPIWDILFRTYYAPKKGEFPPTGLATGEVPSGVTHCLVWPIAYFIRSHGQKV